MTGLRIAIAYVIALTLVGAAQARCGSGGSLFGLGDERTPRPRLRCGFSQVSPAAVEETFRSNLASRLAGCVGQAPDGSPVPEREQFQAFLEAFEQWDGGRRRPKEAPPSDAQIRRGAVRFVDVLTRAEAEAPGTAACWRFFTEASLAKMSREVPPTEEAARAMAAFVRLFEAARRASFTAEGVEPEPLD